MLIETGIALTEKERDFRLGVLFLLLVQLIKKGGETSNRFLQLFRGGRPLPAKLLQVNLKLLNQLHQVLQRILRKHLLHNVQDLLALVGLVILDAGAEG